MVKIANSILLDKCCCSRIYSAQLSPPDHRYINMSTRKRIHYLRLGIISILLSMFIDHYVDLTIDGSFEGFYLTRSTTDKTYELSDHLIVGEEKRIIYARNLTDNYLNMARRLFPEGKDRSSHLYCEWNPWSGSGLVSNYFADGTGMVTYLGRYLDDSKEVHGLFVGGGIPETVANSSNYNMNNSGMTYFDGSRWYHIWCSVNEGIGSAKTGVNFTPAEWEFLGSKVEKRSNNEVIITSSHKVFIDTIPARIDRRMHFTAGQPYITLEITVTNSGREPLYYHYLYGDEPWVGFYGTSLGDVGWLKDRLATHEEAIDTANYSYIGMADLGNSVIGEQPIYTNLANFLEWFGPEQPKIAYFTNDLQHIPTGRSEIPLESNERFLGVQWNRWLQPLESATMRLAVGMASVNPRTGIPEKPPISWN